MELTSHHIIQEEKKQCHHCHSDVQTAFYNQAQVFCCQGCLNVFSILNNHGLSNYYELSQTENKKIPQVVDIERYDYLKEDDFHEAYKLKGSYLFYVKGIECFACNWLFDNIKELSPHIKSAYYDHSFKSLKIEVFNNDMLYAAVLPILQLGYDLEPIKDVETLKITKKQNNRSGLIRLAVAMLVMGNIGTLSLSDYLGVKGELLRFLQVLSSVIFIAIPTYCSLPFYRNTLNLLKAKRISLDLPISLSIIVGSCVSYYNLLTNSYHIYFDSLATLVFLILAVRYILNRIYEKAAAQHSGLVETEQVFRTSDGEKKAIHSSLVKTGDHIQIPANHLCLVDGTILKGFSYFNESLMTGEAVPVLKSEGNHVYKGSFNYSHEIEVLVSEENKVNPIESFLQQVKQRSLAFSNFSLITRNYSVALIGVYVLAAIGLFVYLDFQVAVERFLALTIIGCPCALGIGIPLASVIANKKLEKQGIVVKDPDFFEKLTEVEQIFLDKTGTITTGEFDILKTYGDKSYLNHLVSLEKMSKHPIAISIVNNFPEATPLVVKSFLVTPGEGVSGYIEGQYYQVNKAENINGVRLQKNGAEVFSIELIEKTRDEDIETLNQLADYLPITVLSGDTDENVTALLNQHSKKIAYLSALKPEEKADQVKKRKALFVGDGLNDIPAMSQSHVSISFNIHDLVNQACHCVLTNPSLKKLQTLFKFSAKLEKLILSNIYFSAFYNIVGAYAAIDGLITPLVAAIFMPISSLGIVLMTLTKGRNL